MLTAHILCPCFIQILSAFWDTGPHLIKCCKTNTKHNAGRWWVLKNVLWIKFKNLHFKLHELFKMLQLYLWPTKTATCYVFTWRSIKSNLPFLVSCRWFVGRALRRWSLNNCPYSMLGFICIPGFSLSMVVRRQSLKLDVYIWTPTLSFIRSEARYLLLWNCFVFIPN